jgi:NADH-quinone oxidoreductase subunit J
VAYVFFGYFAGVIALTAVLVVALRNPVYSVLALLVMFFHVAGLFVTLHAEFLFAVQLMVYAGAILIFYLFAVMFLTERTPDRYHIQSWGSLLIGGAIIVEIAILVGQHGVSFGSTLERTASSSSSEAGNTESIGRLLYTTYLFPFEVASLILLVAMIGAIVLSKKDLSDSPPS